MSEATVGVDAGAQDFLGLLGASALAAMTRFAKDGDQAPDVQARIAHARMAGAAWTAWTEIEVWASHRDLDLPAAVATYEGIFDDLDARTRPTTWWERSVKTYVTAGVWADFLSELAARRGVFGEVAEWDLGQGEWERCHLARLTESDEQLAARLSLWARRVAGEVLGLVRSTLFTHPGLVGDPDAVDAIVEAVTLRHRERMASIHLKA